MGKCTLPVLPEIHTRPHRRVSPHFLQPGRRCFLQPFHLCRAPRLQISSGLRAFSKREFGFFFSFPLLLWSSSFTDKKWRMSSIYSAMHHLKVLSRSNSLLQPGVLSPYDFHVCFLSCICRTRAAAAAKSLQSCPTLCDPMDRSPPGSPIPGILQARTLEWVAISFSNP